jgi:hypothetical protein
MPNVFLNSIVTGYFYENTLEPDENMVRYHGSNFTISNRSAYFERYVGNIIKDKDPLSGINTVNNKEDNTIRIGADGYISSDIAYPDCKANLTVYNMIGKVILTDEFEKTSSVSLNTLSKGVYIINLIYNNQSCSKKYIVQ